MQQKAAACDANCMRNRARGQKTPRRANVNKLHGAWPVLKVHDLWSKSLTCGQTVVERRHGLTTGSASNMRQEMFNTNRIDKQQGA